METVRGTVSNCQHTIKVSGGGNNTSTTTTYIALFRVAGRPVEFRTSAPSSISDGDQVVAAGSMRRGSLNALACRNLTTGEVMNTGIWGYVIGTVILLVIGTVIGLKFAASLGTLVVLFDAVVMLAVTAYFVYRVVLTRRAVAAVRG